LISWFGSSSGVKTTRKRGSPPSKTQRIIRHTEFAFVVGVLVIAEEEEERVDISSVVLSGWHCEEEGLGSEQVNKI
jgi:hypothetical protein